ncbi:MAG: flagellar brake protein [Rhodocyclaceae bacterium]|nr:flagellar brake protein [Rhodocyclaceae bacterium]
MDEPHAEGSQGQPPTQSPAKAPPLLEPGDYAQYMLHARGEISFVLKNLLERAAEITLFFDEGKELLPTTLIAVDSDRILLDFGASMETNRKALAAQKLFCVTALDKVRIQFVLRGLTQTTYQGRPAFSAGYPTDVLRLQRREFFRLTMPITRPLKCQIPIAESESGNNFVIDVNVVDISGGGLAIALPEGIAFDPNREFADCRIELPEVGLLTATLKVCNQFEITVRSGSRVRRAGCQFVGLPGPMLTLVQRYIIKVERERKARESGII